MSKQIKNTSAKLFRIVVVFCIVVIMGVLGKTPAKAQEMVEGYGSYNFADAYADENIDVIWGFGSTEAWANSWNHESRVILYFLSPDGNYCTYDSNFTGGYAYGYASFGFDQNNLGNYVMQVDNRNWCPVASREFAQAYTSADVRVGASLLAYYFDNYSPADNTCHYQIKGICDVTHCKSTNPSFHPQKPSNRTTCPPWWLVSFRWTEHSGGCSCTTICIKGGDEPHDEEVYCSELGLP
jgi:hypothetical protein